MIAYFLDKKIKDVTYKRRYMDILKNKDFVIKIDKKQHNLSYKIEPSFALIKNKQNDTIVTKVNSIVNNARILCLAHMKHNLSVIKYVEKKFCNIVCYRCSYLCLIINYILKKYAKCKLKNKTILTISHISINLTMHLVEDRGTIFTPEALYLFDHSKNCTIYGIINVDNNNNKYKQTIINKKNNNTYHFLTWNTNGNIMDINTFNTINNRILGIVFDCVIAYRIFDTYINNILIAYLHIMTRHSDDQTQLLCQFTPVSRDMFLSIFAFMYDSVRMYITFIHADITIMHATNLKKNDHYKNIDMIYDVFSSDKYIDVQYNVPTYIEQYYDAVYMNIYRYHDILVGILDLYHTDKYSVVMKDIKKKQHYYAKKYKNLISPY